MFDFVLFFFKFKYVFLKLVIARKSISKTTVIAYNIKAALWIKQELVDVCFS